MLVFAANLINIVAILSIVALGVNLLIGYAGLFSLAQAGVFGVGAYTYAIMTVDAGATPLVGAAAAIAFATLASAAVAIPAFRISGDYLVVASFGVELVLFSLFLNLDITGAAAGFSGIQPLTILGVELRGPVQSLLLNVPVMALAFVAFHIVVRSPLGQVLQGIRFDETGTTSLGKNVIAAKLLAFALAGALAGTAGVLYAVYIRFLGPETFGLEQTIVILTMVLIGGAGTRIGTLVGCFLVVVTPELLRFSPLPQGVQANVNLMIYGIILIVIAVFRPQGLLGRKGLLERWSPL